MGTYTRKGLTPWTISSLDITYYGMTKQYSQEIKGIEQKYDLSPDKFENFVLNFSDKSDRYFMKNICSVTMTETEVITHRQDTWQAFDATKADTDNDKIQDKKIKANLLGTSIYESLTDSTKRAMKNSKDKWDIIHESLPVKDSPSLFWYISNYVKPGNCHLVDALKKRIRALHIKNFRFSIKTMLTEFEVRSEEISDCGGTYALNE